MKILCSGKETLCLTCGVYLSTQCLISCSESATPATKSAPHLAKVVRQPRNLRFPCESAAPATMTVCTPVPRDFYDASVPALPKCCACCASVSKRCCSCCEIHTLGCQRLASIPITNPTECCACHAICCVSSGRTPLPMVPGPHPSQNRRPFRGRYEEMLEPAGSATCPSMFSSTHSLFLHLIRGQNCLQFVPATRKFLPSFV